MKDVEHVAKLARLDLTEEEKNRFTDQLNAILKYADKLTELDTDGIEPTSHAMEIINVVRDDITVASTPIAKVLLNAPDEDEDQFKVPAVIE
jgi:aspartyl-tRNA(Asn)/glutamyl-tRNA(Gln) amidotransferase subunit C